MAVGDFAVEDQEAIAAPLSLISAAPSSLQEKHTIAISRGPVALLTLRKKCVSNHCKQVWAPSDRILHFTCPVFVKIDEHVRPEGYLGVNLLTT